MTSLNGFHDIGSFFENIDPSLPLSHILLNMLMEYCHLLADPSPTKCMTSVMTSFMDGPLRVFTF